MLAHPAGWMRRTAHRLLVEEPKPALAEAVRLVASSERPQARLHALYVLDAWGVLSDADIRRAMADEQPEIRLHGIRLAETCLVCRPDIVGLAIDGDARVVLQAALSMGQFNDQEALRAMSKIAMRYAGEPWIRKALLSSEKGSSMEMAEMLAGAGFFSVEVPARQALLQELAGVHRPAERVSRDLVLRRVFSRPRAASAGVLAGRRVDGIAGWTGFARGSAGH